VFKISCYKPGTEYNVQEAIASLFCFCSSTTVDSNFHSLGVRAGGRGVRGQPKLGKAFFQTIAKCLCSSQQPKMKNISFSYLLHKNGLHSFQQHEVPEIQSFSNYCVSVR